MHSADYCTKKKTDSLRKCQQKIKRSSSYSIFELLVHVHTYGSETSARLANDVNIYKMAFADRSFYQH